MHKKLLHAFAIVVLFASSTAFSMNRRDKHPPLPLAIPSVGRVMFATPIIPAAFTLGGLVAHTYNDTDTATFCGMAALVTTMAMPGSKTDN